MASKLARQNQETFRLSPSFQQIRDVVFVGVGTAAILSTTDLPSGDDEEPSSTPTPVPEEAQPPQINWGQEEKHFEGHNSYTPGRSTLTANPEELAQKAGTGTPVNTVPRGQPGFRERVDFGKVIGNYVDKSGKSIPTTKGIIHYSKDGIHVVPAKP